MREKTGRNLSRKIVVKDDETIGRKEIREERNNKVAKRQGKREMKEVRKKRNDRYMERAK